MYEVVHRWNIGGTKVAHFDKNYLQISKYAKRSSNSSFVGQAFSKCQTDVWQTLNGRLASAKRSDCYRG